jgi:hypothetical protein
MGDQPSRSASKVITQARTGAGRAPIASKAAIRQPRAASTIAGGSDRFEIGSKCLTGVLFLDDNTLVGEGANPAPMIHVRSMPRRATRRGDCEGPAVIGGEPS